MSRARAFHPEIHAAFLCEFHAIQGPRIALAVSSGSAIAPDLGTAADPPVLPPPPPVTPGVPPSSSSIATVTPASVAAAAPSDPLRDREQADATPTQESVLHHQLHHQSQSQSSASAQPPPPPASVPPLQNPSRPSLPIMFDTISEFLIPKPALCGHPTSIGIDQYRMLGHPVLLEDPKYPRNVALWNLVLVVDRGADVRGLEPPVTKLAQVFRSLELEAEYMTNAKFRPALYCVLQQLVHDLNTMREARIAVPHSSVILDIRLAPVLSAHPPEVNLWDVPVVALDFAHVPLAGWDLTLTRLVPLINGTRSVYQLALVADVDPALVRVAVQHLVHVGAVYLVDVFQLTNMYVPTAKLRRLANDVDAQEACVQYILRPNHHHHVSGSAAAAAASASTPGGNGTSGASQGMATSPTATQSPSAHLLLTPTRVLTLYAAMKPGTTVAEFIANTAFPTSVADIRRFIVFGVTKGWIRRVHRYPIFPPPPPPPPPAHGQPGMESDGGGFGQLHPHRSSLRPPQPSTTASGGGGGAWASGAMGSTSSAPQPAASGGAANGGHSRYTSHRNSGIGFPSLAGSPSAGGVGPNAALTPLIVPTTMDAAGPSTAPPLGFSPHSYGRSSYGGGVWGSVPGGALFAGAAGGAGTGQPAMSPTVGQAGVGAAGAVGGMVGSSSQFGQGLPLDAFCVMWRMTAKEAAEVLSAKYGVRWVQK